MSFLTIHMYRVSDSSCHPQTSLCQNPEKYRVLNWPPSEITKSRTCHPPKMAESPTLVSLGVASSGHCHFWGWQVLDLVFSRGGQFRTFFSGFWHIGKFWGGKKDQTPCMKRYAWSMSLETFRKQLKISRITLEANLASYPEFRKQPPRIFKTVCNTISQ